MGRIHQHPYRIQTKTTAFHTGSQTELCSLLDIATLSLVTSVLQQNRQGPPQLVGPFQPCIGRTYHVTVQFDADLAGFTIATEFQRRHGLYYYCALCVRLFLKKVLYEHFSVVTVACLAGLRLQ